MVVAKVLNAAKWTVETVKGAGIVLTSSHAPVPPTDLHPRMMARPWTFPEYIRMWSWRHCWKYLPIFRFYIYSAVIFIGVFKFVVPIKPRHMIQYHKGKEDAHHHEVEHMYGTRQNRQDAEYFKKYNPLKKEGEAELDNMIRQCFQTLCKDWMVECHWFCDSIKGPRPATKPLHSNPFFRKELEARLAHQRTLVEESELHQPKVLQRKTSGDGQTFCVYYKKPHNYIGRPSAPIPNYQKMEGQICRTKLPSDYEIDKIVHEKRTTTVTEQKETIHKNNPNHNALQAPPTDPKDLPDPIDRPYVRAADRNQGPPHGQYQANK
ncbi:hypothetical protein WR25_08859 isoform C [Diploscapter pachys]|uniref:CB1 cannabinoid receptor-interacting protein 1 n=1 Tax=Diploscapter pachys TaxID=2018661 RepID=A0A2A2JB51_9BILA|nr:hypothetical protein WR25_08859 isoform C [Diploscapter pachys]